MIRVNSAWSISKSIRGLVSLQNYVSFSTGKDNSSNNDKVPTDANKQPFYVHKTNYNFEQNKKYTRQVEAALKQHQEEQELQITIKKEGVTQIPRRLRRKYDKPKYDLNIENYSAWRTYDKEVLKIHPDSFPVVCKIPIAPAKLVKVFGKPPAAQRNPKATAEYDFEDNNLDQFLLYDYKATTEYWGPNIEGFNYENQESVHPRKRLEKMPNPDEFWQSEEEHLFRLNCTRYADFGKFKKWILAKIEEADKKGTSYEQEIEKKFGKIETYDNYDKKYEVPRDMAVFLYNKSFYLEKGDKHEKKTKYHDKITPSKQLGNEYLRKVTDEAEEAAKDFKNSQSSNKDREGSPDEEYTRPRARKTGTYQSTVSSLQADEWKNQLMSNTFNESKMNASLAQTSSSNTFSRKLDRVGTVTEGMIDVNKSTNLGEDKEEKIVRSNMKFVEKSDWKDSPNCFVCGRGFDKMKGVFEHHCRACGRAVCGECSTRKINEQRVCDVCFFRTANPRAEERRKDVIKMKRATMESYRNQVKKEKEELNLLESKRLDLERRMNEDKDSQENAKGTLQREKERANDTLTKKVETTKKFQESLQVDKNYMREKEVELDEFKTKISSLKLEIAQKKTILQTKKEEFHRLQQQKLAYESSASFLDISGMQQMENPNNVSMALSDGGSNKISLSRQPTKI